MLGKEVSICGSGQWLDPPSGARGVMASGAVTVGSGGVATVSGPAPEAGGTVPPSGAGGTITSAGGVGSGRVGGASGLALPDDPDSGSVEMTKLS